MHSRFRGLVAAPFTPFGADLSINFSAIPAYSRLLCDSGVGAAFICGTTDEGLSRTLEVRMTLAEVWMRHVDDRFPVIVHVGHSALVYRTSNTRVIERARAGEQTRLDVAQILAISELREDYHGEVIVDQKGLGLPLHRVSLRTTPKLLGCIPSRIWAKTVLP